MKESGKVRIALESVQDGDTIVHSYEGEWFRKERSIYVRYSELAVPGDPESGEVRTLVRYRPGELSIVRRGAIESEQLFMPGLRRDGYYRSPLTTFPLETEATQLELHAAEEDAGDGLPSRLPFTLEWQYVLHVSDQMSGRFHIRLHIQGEMNS
ncbi:hypothetical protein D3C78_1256910 [compost metagenome]